MSAVRVRKKTRAPLAYVPIEPNKVVVLPTDDIPRPDTPSSPVNQASLQERAEQLASPSTSRSTPRQASPNRSRSRTVNLPFPPRIVTPPQRAAAASKSAESVVPDTSRGESTARSWFTDYVMRSRAPSMTGGSMREDRPRQSTEAIRADELNSSSQVDVIIPDEARSALGQVLANREQKRGPMGGSDMSLAELHHSDIVEHLDVIGKSHPSPTHDMIPDPSIRCAHIHGFSSQ